MLEKVTWVHLVWLQSMMIFFSLHVKPVQQLVAPRAPPLCVSTPVELLTPPLAHFFTPTVLTGLWAPDHNLWLKIYALLCWRATRLFTLFRWEFKTWTSQLWGNGANPILCLKLHCSEWFLSWRRNIFCSIVKLGQSCLHWLLKVQHFLKYFKII